VAGRILTRGLTALGVLLYMFGLAPLVRWLGRSNPKVLLYHDCAEVESGYLADLECTTPPGLFAQHLAYIKRHYNVVDLETIVACSAPPGAVAITFDDGYRSVYHGAFPQLRREGLPATVYLIADVVGNDALVWVNELNHALRERPHSVRPLVTEWFGVPDSASPLEIISHCRLNYDPHQMNGLLDAIRAEVGRDGQSHAREAELYLDWGQVAEMEQNGITFGNHTCTHPNMERLSEEQQAAEILGAQQKLASRLRVVHSFAHPFGHRGSHAARIAMEAGARCAADVGGSNRPVEPLRLGRVHISGEGIPELFARMEVVEPVKEALRRIARRLRPQPALN
jgi:peptidoglycan/xylan/chitin deacetylase (PgdA/CDA1 family)